MLARPGLPNFEYLRANTPAQVGELLQQDGVRLMMGGTDLFPQMREGKIGPRLVVDVKHLLGMREVTFHPEEGLRVGAAVTMNQLARNPDVRERYPLLAQAAKSVASYQLRNRATIGGNLCNASPCADTSPAVLALDGVLMIRGPQGQREIPAAKFFLGPGKTALGLDEYLTAIRFPVPPSGHIGRYLKLGRNRRGDLSVVGVAVIGYPDIEANSSHSFRIALGSVAPTPLRVPAAESALAESRLLGKEAFSLAGEQAKDLAAPITDVRAGATYQTMMVRTLTIRALREVWRYLESQRGA